MSAIEVGAISRRIYQAFNRREIGEIANHVDADAEIVVVPMARRYRGPEGFEALVRQVTSSFSDLTVTLTNQVIAETQVANELIVRGTHDGLLILPDAVIPATGRTVEYAVADIVRLRDSKVSDLYSYFDAASIVRQLGRMD